MLQPLYTLSGHLTVLVTPFYFTYPVKALCTESQFPEDRFVDNDLAFNDAKEHAEAWHNSTDGDNFYFINADYIYGPRCQLLTCNNYVKGDSLPYTLDPIYR